MTDTRAFVLGVVQGLGEFLPISSSAHLIVVPWLLGWDEHSLAFDVALHLGTLAAVLYAFFSDWVRLVGSGMRCLLRGRPFAEPDARLLWLLALASLPAALAGLLLEHWAETAFRSPMLVAFTMSLLGAILFAADRQARSAPSGELGVKHALLIGCSQAFAIVPGVSRSGATISTGLFLGYTREQAARFSFLLATPITAGAALLKVPKLLAAGETDGVLIGMLTAGLVGFLSIRLLLQYVRTKDYRPFVLYRFAFSVLVAFVFVVRASLLR